MKKTLLLLFCCLAAKVTIYAQADPSNNNTKLPVTRTIESFGAIANDGIDDSYAFEKAARFFSNKDTIMGTAHMYIDYDTLYGVLDLDAGTYIVGEQDVWNSDTATWYARAKYTPLFQSMDGFIIQGKTTLAGNILTKIQIKPGIYFGYFERSNATTPHDPKLPDSTATGGIQGVSSIALWIGSDAKNVLIKNVELDGSANSYEVGAPQNSTGDYNLAFGHGIAAGAKFLSIENVYVHNFGSDGIYINASNDHDPNGRWNVTINGVRSQWNGRHGFGWGSGRDVKVENSVFAYSGLPEGLHDYDNSFSLHPVAGSLSCNIDIETDAGNIRNGVFKKCGISGNAKGWSLVFNGHTTTTYVDSMRFDSCDIKGYVNNDPMLGGAIGSIGLDGANGRNFNFTNCDIVGTITLPAPAANPGTTRFENCSIFGSQMKIYETDYPTIMGTESAEFDNCNITSQNRKAIFEIVQKSGPNTFNDPNKYIKVNNCTMNFNYDPNIHGPSPIGPGLAWFMRFTGNTTWNHIPETSLHNTFMQCITVNGSSMVNPMNTFKFANGHANIAPNDGWRYVLDSLNNMRYPFIFGETPCEFLNVNLGDQNGGSRFISSGRPVYIGEGVTFTVKSGSYLVLYDSIYLAGKIVVEPGGNLFFYSAKVFVRNDGIQHIVGSVGWADYSIITVTNRSQLMAPQQFLKSGINPSYYDSPEFIGCTKCYEAPNSPIGLNCIEPGEPDKFITTVKYTDQLSTNNKLTLYPNPTTDKVQVHFVQEGTTAITLMDINGKILQTLTSENNYEELSLKQYPAGTYLIKISNAGTSSVKKVTKTN